MKRLNPFGYTTYFIVEEVDKDNPKWLTEWAYERVEEDDLESWKATVMGNLEEMPEFKFEKFTLRNKEYMEKCVIGSMYDDYSNHFVDIDCPECEHLLVEQDDNRGMFCSNHECNYVNERVEELEREEELERSKPHVEAPKFREEGQTLEQFIEKYGFVDRDFECVTCKQRVAVSDFYVSFGYAQMIYGKNHLDDCTNKKCPASLIPIGKKKEEWRNLL